MSERKPLYADTQKEDEMHEAEFVPCLSEAENKSGWCVCNYLNAGDVRFWGSYTECEKFIRDAR